MFMKFARGKRNKQFGRIPAISAHTHVNLDTLLQVHVHLLLVALLLLQPRGMSNVPTASGFSISTIGRRRILCPFGKSLARTSLFSGIPIHSYHHIHSSGSNNKSGTGAFLSSHRLLFRRRNTEAFMSNSKIDGHISPTVCEREVKIRILCLHGKGNSGKSFQSLLYPLEEKLRRIASINSNTDNDPDHIPDAQASSSRPPIKFQFEFDYLDAPFQMEQGNCNKLQWWTLPPGVRSFNAEEYKGFEQSAQLVEHAMTSYRRMRNDVDVVVDGDIDIDIGSDSDGGDNKSTDAPYQIILGHSQGAILLSTLMTNKAWTEQVFGSSGSGDVDDKVIDNERKAYPMLGYVLNGCAWPNPYSIQLESYQYLDQHPYPHLHENENETGSQSLCELPKSLFVIGHRDKINPPEGAERVRDALIRGGLKGVETCYHPGGHSIPVQDQVALETIARWIVERALSAYTL